MDYLSIIFLGEDAEIGKLFLNSEGRLCLAASIVSYRDSLKLLKIVLQARTLYKKKELYGLGEKQVVIQELAPGDDGYIEAMREAVYDYQIYGRRLGARIINA